MLRDQPGGFSAVMTGQALVGPAKALDQLSQLFRIVTVNRFHARLVALV